MAAQKKPQPTAGVSNLPVFALERYFAKYEFTARYNAVRLQHPTVIIPLIDPIAHAHFTLLCFFDCSVLRTSRHCP